jgi:hypothetical protein
MSLGEFVRTILNKTNLFVQVLELCVSLHDEPHIRAIFYEDIEYLTGALPS